MGVEVEFNHVLALRRAGRASARGRKQEELIPNVLNVGEAYRFLKSGQRIYPLGIEIELTETSGDNAAMLRVGFIIIEECKHVLVDGKVWTAGTYRFGRRG